MRTFGALVELLPAVPQPVLVVTVVLFAVVWGLLALYRGRALLLPQDSADRRELALRQLELSHERRMARRQL